MKNNRFEKKSSGFTLIELIVVLVLIVFIGQMALVTAQINREKKNRETCANNLRQIGMALQIYSNNYNQIFPRGNYDGKKPVQAVCDLSGNTADDPFTPKVGKAVGTNNVPLEFWLLIRTQGLVPALMICPSTSNKADPVTFGNEDVIKQANFSTPDNLSYSIQNAYADPDSNFAWNNTIDPDVAIAADMNPGKTADGSDVTKVDVNSAADIVKGGNSMNHKQDGQNVLFADSHVAWETTCMCGHNSDNIYGPSTSKIGDKNPSPKADATLIDSPKNKDDSALLPTQKGGGAEITDAKK